ncbi:hypothetical protein TRVA0_017S01684 [Trichomonascus vanleenenianus]|uniref:MICOS complex subunit Mic12 family protein n=1 Tax=Trichomonascus vanleenenianus TaxID=2268995 RepID=UPI003ECB1877
MIRTAGFIGGVITTSSIAYLTALEMRKNSTRVAKSLHESSETIENLGKPKPFDPRVIEFSRRDSISETMKDLWNDEITTSVGWVYRKLGYESE